MTTKYQLGPGEEVNDSLIGEITNEGGKIRLISFEADCKEGTYSFYYIETSPRVPILFTEETRVLYSKGVSFMPLRIEETNNGLAVYVG